MLRYVCAWMSTFKVSSILTNFLINNDKIAAVLNYGDLQDLSKGANCYMRVKGCPIQDIYLVDLLEANKTMNNMLTGTLDGLCNLFFQNNLFFITF